jgi:hypothetical protein
MLETLNDASCVYTIIIIGMNVVDNLNSVYHVYLFTMFTCLPCMSSRNMCLLPWAALHSDSEQYGHKSGHQVSDIGKKFNQISDIMSDSASLVRYQRSRYPAPVRYRSSRISYWVPTTFAVDQHIPLTPSGESWSDLAEIFSILYFVFCLPLLKSYCQTCT